MRSLASGRLLVLVWCGALALVSQVGCFGGCPTGSKAVGSECVADAESSEHAPSTATTPGAPASEAQSSGEPALSDEVGPDAASAASPPAPAASDAGGAPSGSAAMSADAASGASGAGAQGNAPEGAAASAGAPADSAGAAMGGPAANGGEGDAASPCQGRANESVCDGATFHVCDASGASTAEMSCMSEALCQLGIMSGQCAECVPGTFRCQAASLQVCSELGQYMDQETCASASLCKAEAGACTAMVCMPGTKTCSQDGSTLRTCNEDGSAFASELPCSAGLCDAQHGRCNQCMPGTKRCDGSEVVACSADGQNETRTACEPRAECWSSTCLAGACQEAPKLAVSSNRCDDGYCDGLGNCVGCLNDAQCAANETCDTRTKTCVSKPCGNGVIDADESCEIAGPNAYAPGTCDPERCLLTTRAFANCTGMSTCGVNDSQWTCAPHGTCTHPCTSPSQCTTIGAQADCVSVSNGRFCAIPCANNSCPAGMRCVDLTQLGVSQPLCGFYQPPAQ